MVCLSVENRTGSLGIYQNLFSVFSRAFVRALRIMKQYTPIYKFCWANVSSSICFVNHVLIFKYEELKIRSIESQSGRVLRDRRIILYMVVSSDGMVSFLPIGKNQLSPQFGQMLM